ncbi:MAG: hypothetical protein U0586_07710 [Candidatus Brocadiaceae bacterium]
MKIWKIFLPLALVLFLNSVAFSMDYSGTWKGGLAYGSLDNPSTISGVTMTFKQNSTNTRFKGSFSVPAYGVKGTVSGRIYNDKFRFTVNITAPGTGKVKGKGIINDASTALGVIFAGDVPYLGTITNGRGYFEKQ